MSCLIYKHVSELLSAQWNGKDGILAERYRRTRFRNTTTSNKLHILVSSRTDLFHPRRHRAWNTVCVLNCYVMQVQVRECEATEWSFEH
jgi:hypothetical protein